MCSVEFHYLKSICYAKIIHLIVTAKYFSFKLKIRYLFQLENDIYDRVLLILLESFVQALLFYNQYYVKYEINNTV